MPQHCHRQHHNADDDDNDDVHHYLLHNDHGTLMCCAVKTQAKKSDSTTKPKESAQLLRLSGEPSGRRVAYNIVWYVTHFRAHCSPFSHSLSLCLPTPLCHSSFLASCPSAPPLVANFGGSLDSSRVAFLLAINIPCTQGSSRQYELRDYSCIMQ